MSDLHFLTIHTSLQASEYSEYNGQQNTELKVECNTTECTMAFCVLIDCIVSGMV